MPESLRAELESSAEAVGISLLQLWYEACRLYGIGYKAGAKEIIRAAEAYLEE
jgi:hypothetical protein